MNISELYVEFKDSPVYADLRTYIEEVLELNRDILEGIKTTDPKEAIDTIRGRSRALRELLRYIDVMASGQLDEPQMEEKGNE